MKSLNTVRIAFMSFSNVSKICDFDFTLEINYYTWPIYFAFELI